MVFVFLNGDILEESSAHISVHDRGLLLGDGLFETMRAYEGKVFRVPAHLARLRSSAAFFRLRFDIGDEDIGEAISELMRRNACPNAYVRLTVTRGPDAKGLRLDLDARPTVLINARPLTPYPPERYRRGVKLIVSTIRQNSASPLPQHKTLNYLPYLLARQEATDAGVHGALLLNEYGQVAEESMSNAFLARGGTLLTPPPYCGLLPGITRAAVMELARAEKIPLEERPVAAGELFECDEMFLTNSLMEIMPVRSVDKRNFPAGAPGPLTARLRERFRSLVPGP